MLSCNDNDDDEKYHTDEGSPGVCVCGFPDNGSKRSQGAALNRSGASASSESLGLLISRSLAGFVHLKQHLNEKNFNLTGLIQSANSGKFAQNLLVTCYLPNNAVQYTNIYTSLSIIYLTSQ